MSSIGESTQSRKEIIDRHHAKYKQTQAPSLRGKEVYSQISKTPGPGEYEKRVDWAASNQAPSLRGKVDVKVPNTVGPGEYTIKTSPGSPSPALRGKPKPLSPSFVPPTGAYNPNFEFSSTYHRAPAATVVGKPAPPKLKSVPAVGSYNMGPMPGDFGYGFKAPVAVLSPQKTPGKRVGLPRVAMLKSPQKGTTPSPALADAITMPRGGVPMPSMQEVGVAPAKPREPASPVPERQQEVVHEEATEEEKVAIEASAVSEGSADADALASAATEAASEEEPEDAEEPMEETVQEASEAPVETEAADEEAEADHDGGAADAASVAVDTAVEEETDVEGRADALAEPVSDAAVAIKTDDFVSVFESAPAASANLTQSASDEQLPSLVHEVEHVVTGNPSNTKDQSTADGADAVDVTVVAGTEQSIDAANSQD